MSNIPPYNIQQMANKSRGTTTRTFRIFKDQADHIDKNNPSMGSFFVRYLIDCWRAGKIPLEVRNAYFDLRKKEKIRIETELKRRATKVEKGKSK